LRFRFRIPQHWPYLCKLAVLPPLVPGTRRKNNTSYWHLQLKRQPQQKSINQQRLKKIQLNKENIRFSRRSRSLNSRFQHHITLRFRLHQNDMAPCGSVQNPDPHPVSISALSKSCRFLPAPALAPQLHFLAAKFTSLVLTELISHELEINCLVPQLRVNGQADVWAANCRVSFPAFFSVLLHESYARLREQATSSSLLFIKLVIPN
jgi:hypothetical protein